ncbi:uncharacterized protein A1O9_07826 [Exophiala aquamarina CBS 119918]|uniref:Uncharacterized protein n=1 Tax=Exophiala aquamarina CBS 119918 TaxID=1182545 RepID=A0A072PL69_9EURO|nr:uncharacterized protein A1O9_07826 [Exophiala aquamarina CBS 119918]KEF56245.1 hypothetical protein A1O9_07826 [Exophiala aquamarina CBS 119918]
MILGIDVTQPGSASMKNAPSIAAVVGSVNAEFLSGLPASEQTPSQEKMQMKSSPWNESLI